MQRLGDPQQGLKVVHVAGTNGKGSVCAMLDSCLRAGGYTCGLYTSPHLVDIRERFRVGGRMISQEEFAEIFSLVLPAVEAMRRSPLGPPTLFEAITALGLLYFVRQKAEVVVLETGLGGRFDATNIFPRPLLTLVTNVELDHTQILGKTLEKIAWEKAGIAKPGVSLVTGAKAPSLSVIRGEWERAQAVEGAPRAAFVPLKQGKNWQAGAPEMALQGRCLGQRFQFRLHGRPANYFLPLLGPHQLENLACVLAGLEILAGQGFRVGPAVVRQGLARVRWPGRLQAVSSRPRIWLDGAHNPDGARALARALPWLRRGRLGLVLGVLKDKDWRGILSPLVGSSDRLFLSAPRNQRALNPAKMLKFIRRLGGRASLHPTVKSALQAARRWACPKDTLVVAGSLYTVGEILDPKPPVSI
jgi:dihydrofolate synthase/folylpolyglutamate synthase